MANAIDLKALAERLATNADRIAASPAGLCTEASMTDLVIAAHGRDGGHGQGRTESVPFGVLFHDPVDRLGQAIDRIERYCEQNPQFTSKAA